MSDNRAVQRFFAYVLMAVGGLITVLCGGCTVLFLGAVFVLGLLSASGTAGMAKGTVLMEFLATALLTGGLPTAVGVALFLIGRAIANDAQ